MQFSFVNERVAHSRFVRRFIWALISERINLLREADIFTLLPQREFFNTISNFLPYSNLQGMTGLGRLTTFSEILYKRLMYDRVRQVTYRSRPGLKLLPGTVAYGEIRPEHDIPGSLANGENAADLDIP